MTVMRRRSFITASGVGLAGAALAAPAIAQTQPGNQMAAGVELPEKPRHDLRRRRGPRQAGRRGDRRQVPDPGLRRRRDRAGVPGARRGAEQHGRVGPHRQLLLCRQGPDVQLRLHDAVRHEHAPAERLDVRTAAGCELMREFFKDYNIITFPAGNTGAQMGGWFRKEIKTVDDLKGVKIRIAGLAGAVMQQARRRAAADRRRRHLPGAREGHDRRRRMGRSLRRREARLLQGRQILLLPRLVGGQAACSRSTSISGNGRSCRRTTRRS